MGEIKFDKRNYRKHNAENKRLIRKSLKECGAGRSVLLDADDSLIAGNGVYEQAKALGIPVRVIETDGTELIAVKRTDLSEDDEKRRLLALADNATSDTSEWDVEAITADLSAITLAEWDISLPDLTGMPEEDTRETAKLSKLEYTGVYYEPKNKPEIHLQDCVDVSKFRAKLSALDQIKGLTEEQKSVLKVFAYRFIKIDFESVANYYAFNATDPEKEAIERLRLVLVDNGLDGFIEDDMLRVTQQMIAGYEKD